jgi:SWIM zinc finger
MNERPKDTRVRTRGNWRRAIRVCWSSERGRVRGWARVVNGRNRLRPPAVSAAVLAEDTLRRLISPGSVKRGDAYFAQGRVRSIVDNGDGMIDAEVQGGRLYNVQLTLERDDLTVRCECPWFEGELEVCKHIWAAMRAAFAKGLLPDRELFLVIEDGFYEPPFDEEEDYEEEIITQFRPTRPYRDSRPPWQRLIEAVGTPPQRRDPSRNLPDEIAYVINPTIHAYGLSFEILGRSRKKGGEWGKWKRISLRLDDLPRLSPFDRETLALLQQRTYSDAIDAITTISAPTTPWWVERLARAGKLYSGHRDGDLHPIAWDDGPPWKLQIAVVDDPAQAKYRVVASVVRENETLPLERIDAIANDILFSGGRASRVDTGDCVGWLNVLRANGSIEIPHADNERFRQALLRTPMANVTLPEDLGWSVVATKPQPLLALTHDGWSTELHGDQPIDGNAEDRRPQTDPARSRTRKRISRPPRIVAGRRHLGRLPCAPAATRRAHAHAVG